MFTNYALSLWIGNLGVVPLFSLAFFLFFPALLSFNFLLVRVFIVLEPMYLSLSYRFNNNLREKFLSFSSQVVKVFVLIIALQEASANQDIFLAKGEQIEISAKSLKSFSVGNQEVIKYKYRPSKKTILIKGKSLGFSDLVIWDIKHNKQVHHIYVSSKKSQLKQMQLIKALERTQLKPRLSGDFIQISGTISNLEEYYIVKKIQASKMDNLILSAELGHQLKNQIIAIIYRQLYEQGVEYVKCFEQQINIFCQYNDPKNLGQLKTLADKYSVTFTQIVNQQLHTNYELKFKILSVETSTNHDYTPGVNKIEFELKEALANNQIQLNSQNFKLQELDYSAKLIANPNIITIVDNNFEVSLGSEIPFQRTNENQVITDWKFAGLKLKGKIQILNGKLALKLDTQITTPKDNQISGPSGSTIRYIESGKIQQIFSVTIDNQVSDEELIPVISKIPILKSIFTSSRDTNSLKKIVCFVDIKEVSSNE